MDTKDLLNQLIAQLNDVEDSDASDDGELEVKKPVVKAQIKKPSSSHQPIAPPPTTAEKVPLRKSTSEEAKQKRLEGLAKAREIKKDMAVAKVNEKQEFIKRKQEEEMRKKQEEEERELRIAHMQAQAEQMMKEEILRNAKLQAKQLSKQLVSNVIAPRGAITRPLGLTPTKSGWVSNEFEPRTKPKPEIELPTPSQPPQQAPSAYPSQPVRYAPSPLGLTPTKSGWVSNEFEPRTKPVGRAGLRALGF